VAKSELRRWQDWRINETSGRSIRADDKRGRRGKGRKSGSSSGWWWTLAAREAECKKCGRQLLQEKIAYRHQAREILCPECARDECVAEMCQPSRKLLRVDS